MLYTRKGSQECSSLISPGRFFAAVELKAMMAHLVLNYDVKMEIEGVVSKLVEFGNILAPNSESVVMFRRRQS